MYDLIVIGAGPGGYTAAIHAAELGAKVCLIEKDNVGGICLNEGCIPTKFIVNSVKVLSEISKASQFGINVENFKLNLPQMHVKKDAVVNALRTGVEFLLKKAKIEIIKGIATFENANTVSVSGPPAGEAGEKIQAKYIIIATGSEYTQTASLKIDHKNILSSTDALLINEIPSSVIVIGGGYIGCEFACIFKQMGSDVTIVEMEKQILPRQDEEMAKRLNMLMKKKGVKFCLGCGIKELKTENDTVTALLENGETLKAQKALLNIGRRPNIKNLGLENAGIKLNGNCIAVNEYMRTNVENIYAVGDAIGSYYLAYTAYLEGKVAAENIFKGPQKIEYGVVPACIFTTPEFSSAGLTEAEAKKQGYSTEIKTYSFLASAKARILDDTDGTIKIIIDTKTDVILGVHILGPDACELIAEATLVVQNKTKAKEFIKIMHAHPTLSESLHDALAK